MSLHHEVHNVYDAKTWVPSNTEWLNHVNQGGIIYHGDFNQT